MTEPCGTPRPFGPSRAQKGLVGSRWVNVLPASRAIMVDLGCGFERLKPARVGDVVIGLDHNPRARPDVICDLEGQYPIRSESVDMVHSSHCIEHLRNRDGVLLEIHRILRRGGIALIKVPHRTHMQAFNFDHRSFWFSGSMNTFANAEWYSWGFPHFDILRIGLHWRPKDGLLDRAVNRVANWSLTLSERYLWLPLGGFFEVQFLIRKA